MCFLFFVVFGPLFPICFRHLFPMVSKLCVLFVQARKQPKLIGSKSPETASIIGNESPETANTIGHKSPNK